MTKLSTELKGKKEEDALHLLQNVHHHDLQKEFVSLANELHLLQDSAKPLEAKIPKPRVVKQNKDEN